MGLIPSQGKTLHKISNFLCQSAKLFFLMDFWIFKNFQKNLKMSFKTKKVTGEERKNKKAQWHPRLRDCF
jgi:hypothetical protein